MVSYRGRNGRQTVSNLVKPWRECGRDRVTIGKKA
jgi:hypothetical protein